MIGYLMHAGLNPLLAVVIQAHREWSGRRGPPNLHFRLYRAPAPRYLASLSDSPGSATGTGSGGAAASRTAPAEVRRL